MPFYRRSYDSMNWAYTNYHSLNFFTGSNVPSDSVLIYNALSGSETAHGVGTNRYCPTTGFTFEFIMGAWPTVLGLVIIYHNRKSLS